eukprot:CAMPEP_0182804008 /NCGR_PEP_ID=MMETSP0006_2-20121128/4329_1 /TAXON_ID=97485 /ORGANISM="Prymnesium parvum, Strain Texoma1" /LENGTH=145 /DNA_ID=CAMNT_0024929513 /DNA_START=596 /DNA_END=1033 /DNA_ORIENTATION=-
MRKEVARIPKIGGRATSCQICRVEDFTERSSRQEICAAPLRDPRIAHAGRRLPEDPRRSLFCSSGQKGRKCLVAQGTPEPAVENEDCGWRAELCDEFFNSLNPVQTPSWFKSMLRHRTLSHIGQRRPRSPVSHDLPVLVKHIDES